MGPYAGRWVKEADADIVEDLRARGRLLRAETYLHAYPHCWRCGTPLLYYAKPSWFVGTSKLRDRLLAANETVDWHPEHIKHGRFGRWLENNVDWAISRERYWGTPLPVWRCKNGHAECMGSFAELEEKSGVTLEDPHRPYVDAPTWDCADCGEPMQREPVVIDVWFDSGCMPFAQHHAPFENEDVFEQRFPANYICEAIDQTRGWFYSLIAVSTLLFDQAPYKTVLCLGHIADPEGKKMSKSLGNIVVPWEVIDQHGADAFRWYFLTSKQPWDGYLFSTETVGESVRQFLLQLWNTYRFYVLYANVNDVTERLGAGDRSRPLGAVAAERDRRDRARPPRRLRRHARRPRDRRVRRRALELVRAPLAPPLLGRRSGRLRHAPHLPRHGRQAARPVHAVHRRRDLRQPRRRRARASTSRTFPVAGERDEALEFDMGVARETGPPRAERACAVQAQGAPAAARRGGGRRGPRAQRRSTASPTSCATSSTSRRSATSPRPTSSAPTRSSPTTARSARASARRCRRSRRRWRRSTPRTSPRRCATARTSGSASTATTTSSAPDDLSLAMKPLEGYQLEREGSHAVALELELDDELRREGLAREIVHAVQNARKEAGLEVEDRIELRLGGDDELLAGRPRVRGLPQGRGARARRSASTPMATARPPPSRVGSCGSLA